MDGVKTVTATFTINTYSISVATVGSGTVAKSPNQPLYDHGTVVQLTANPGTGWSFTSWSGAATGTVNPVNVTMDGVKSVTATFTINTYALSVTTVGSGTVSKSPNQPLYDHGTVVQLTATAATGWSFADWSGDATGTTNPLAVTMDAAKSVTATFTINTYALYRDHGRQRHGGAQSPISRSTTTARSVQLSAARPPAGRSRAGAATWPAPRARSRS